MFRGCITLCSLAVVGLASITTAWAQEGEEGKPSLKIGVDLYWGVSDVSGYKSFTDYFWAAHAIAVPSTVFLEWSDGKGSKAKIAHGIGKYYTANDSIFDNPSELWFSVPMGAATATIGKFWVPFGIQEWQYETKPGIMFDWQSGPVQYTAAAVRNTLTDTENVYARVGYSVDKDVTVGLSGAVGKGLSFGTSHDRGWAFDAVVHKNDFALYAEYVDLKNPAGQQYQFSFGKLAYEGFGKLVPWIAYYDITDDAGEFGVFQSAVGALDYQLTEYLSLRAAYADTSEGNHVWGQVHFNYRF